MNKIYLVSAATIAVIAGLTVAINPASEHVESTPKEPLEVTMPAYGIDSSVPEVSLPISDDSPDSVQSKNAVARSKSTQKIAHQELRQPSPVRVEGDSIVAESGERSPLREYRALYTPNDPQASQWWTSDVGLESIWTQQAPGYQATVAVIDSGFALQHEELANQWLVNNGETGVAVIENPSDLNCTDQAITLDMSCNNFDDDYNGIVDDESGVTTLENISLLNCTDQSIPLDKSCNLIDDDGNGLVDDAVGYDFSSNERSPQAGEIDPNGDGVAHGTQVAGVIAAKGDNAAGTSGVNWHAKVLPLQALRDDGVGNTIGIYRAILYAIERDVDVINLSLGGPYTDPYIQYAVDQAYAAGIVVVAASGNDGCDCLIYPASYNSVVSTGSYSLSGAKSSFTNWNSQLDVLAPGVSIYAPSWIENDQTTNYRSSSGTSFAAPIVSGLISHIVSMQNDLTQQEIIALLTETTDKTYLNGQPFVKEYGFGRVRASNIVSRIGTPITDKNIYELDGLVYSNFYANESMTGMRPYTCRADGRTPNIPIYRMKKLVGNAVHYTSDTLWIENAGPSGYSATFSHYACALYPWDTPQSVKNTNILDELENSNFKDYL